MSDPSSSRGPGEPAGEDPRANPAGVRTYRGRTIEELIPRIRAELGPDAIILRQREGLTGGIGGFFAQRCVEIDAQAAPRVNIYAGDEEFEESEESEGSEGSEEWEELDDAEAGEPDWDSSEWDAPEPLGSSSSHLEGADPDLQATREQPALGRGLGAAGASAAPGVRAGFDAPAAPPVAEMGGAAPGSRPHPLDELTSAPAAPPPAAAPASDPPARAGGPPPALGQAVAPGAAAPSAGSNGSGLFDEASFAARLEEATLAAQADEETAAPDPGQPAEAEAGAPPEMFIAFDELGDAPDDRDPWDEPALSADPGPTGEAVARTDADADADADGAQNTLDNRAEPDTRSGAAAEPAGGEVPGVDALPAAAPANEVQVMGDIHPDSAVEREGAAALDPGSRFSEPEPPDPSAPWMAMAAEPFGAPSDGEPVAPIRPAPPRIADAAPTSQAGPMPSTLRPGPSPAVADSGAEAPRDAGDAEHVEAAPDANPTADPEPAPPAEPTPAAQPAPPTSPWLHAPRRRSGLLPMAERMLRAALEATAAANERRGLQTPGAPYPGAAYPGAPYTGAPYPGAAAPGQTPATAAAAAAAPPPAAPLPAPTTPAASNPFRTTPATAPAHPAATPDAPVLERRLIRSGMTPHRAAALVAAALSRRGGPSSSGDLASDLRAVIRESLPPAVPLPEEHGTIVVVGAGGAGKTHSVASLAAERARAGQTVSVASHGTPLHEDELGELLHGESVNVIPAMRTRATARAIASARARGLVIVDTATASPGDAAALESLAEAVQLFKPDAVLLAVPATLSPSAALTLVDAFSVIECSGILATRLDEVDGLGVIVELALQTGLPLALTHAGVDLQQAVGSADPVGIASALV